MTLREMDGQLRSIFVHEVERQSRFALLAYEDMTRALGRGDVDRLWFAVQSFLGAVGNVSKLLWPSMGATYSREALKTDLGVTGESPLAPREFRNHFEHYDERLERWASSSRRRNFVDSCIGPPTGMIAGIDPEDFLLNFDSANFAVTFRGKDPYHLKPIVKALEDINSAAAALFIRRLRGDS